jgi:hypothetical protein
MAGHCDVQSADDEKSQLRGRERSPGVGSLVAQGLRDRDWKEKVHQANQHAAIPAGPFGPAGIRLVGRLP